MRVGPGVVVFRLLVFRIICPGFYMGENIRVRFESKLLRKAARGKRCVLCNACDDTIVLAHLPGSFYGMAAGTGQKTHDWLGAHLCMRCHEKMDTIWRRETEIRMKALCLTLERLFEEGIIVVR